MQGNNQTNWETFGKIVECALQNFQCCLKQNREEDKKEDQIKMITKGNAWSWVEPWVREENST